MNPSIMHLQSFMKRILSTPMMNPGQRCSNTQNLIQKRDTPNTQPSSLKIPVIMGTEAFVIRVYMHYNIYEQEFIIRELIQTIPCDVTVSFHVREQILEDIVSPDPVVKDSIFIILADGALNQQEVQIIEPSDKIKDIIFFHLSDEFDWGNGYGLYENMAVVYHNYFRRKVNGRGDWTYLYENASEPSCEAFSRDKRRVFWFPLGYGPNFNVFPAMKLSYSERPLLFAFSGRYSTVERIALLKSLDQDERVDELLNHSLVHVYKYFASDGAKLRYEYSQILAYSKITPCPSGGNAEQFRIWEALASGSIPLVKEVHKNDGHLTPHFEVGLNLLTIPHWANFSSFMRHIQSGARDKELAQLQTILGSNYLRIMRSFRNHFHKAVCCMI
eukprot:TRINITY_DN12759_c1_g1_i2.p1 TRINITY_DN12759_c1_g1~~TRINITY_DN12759_c1_g1_i2.p1  ORF type:complete len:387 (-),score=72.71 TRINITY_DN12759_c1_g1_i2:20-1180(-)